MKGLILFLITCTALYVSCRSPQQETAVFPPYEEMIGTADSVYTAGDLADAIRAYRKVHRAYPDSAYVHRVLSRAYLGLGMLKEAKDMLDATSYSQDTLGRLSKFRHYANWSIFAGDTTLLRTYTDSILFYAFHTYPSPYRNAAFNEVFLKDYDRAMAHLDRFVAYGEPEQKPINMAFLYLEEGDSASAHPILEEAGKGLTLILLKDPVDTDALFELAEVHAIKKDTAVAMDYLERAVQTGLGKQWWIYHLISDTSVPDPVFGALKDNTRFLRLKDSLMEERRKMREELMNGE
ncbi:tetratricopeptide repeat protein [Robertkochia sediminum]|uniref:tetratricopeptide repeat protein n=1 Tax=Robertkochia sediminum TaxID=2785326 RepID=UPI001931798A|nr:tetratricopeptide repeat protein [Robertkochia sediminum]MBL7471348.1 tetratricopeptide repeat protein [Robertkochia sediminum]